LTLCTSTSVTRALGNTLPIMVFLRSSVSELEAGTDGQTDGQTDGPTDGQDL